jgi:predicted Zn-ribbon and HTH transcriptional regulator
MSFEGYYQLLCPSGHHWTADVHSAEGKGRCPHCDSEPVWQNTVDLTNGSWDGNNWRIDGYIELKEATAAEICRCPNCDDEHVKTPPTYHIPQR